MGSAMIQNRHPHPARRSGVVLSGAVCGVMLILLAGLLVLPSAGAQAQDRDVRALIDQVGRLQQDLADLQRHVYRGEHSTGPSLGTTSSPAGGAAGGTGGQAIATLHFRLTDLEARMAELTGRIEEASYATQRLNDRFEKLSSDIDFRLVRLEEKLAATGTGSPPAPQAPDKPAGDRTSDRASGDAMDDRGPKTLGTLPQSAVNGTAEPNRPAQQQAALPADASPREVYDQAFQTLVRQDFPAAERQFKAFLAKHKDHELAGNAQYWLAETYYVRGQFEQAAVAFAEGFEKHPKNAKAPDNLLKMGLSLSNLNRKQDACVAFSELMKQYPNAAQSVRRRAELERQNLKCP